MRADLTCGRRRVAVHSRLYCTDPSCRTIYQRDFNAARNIYLNPSTVTQCARRHRAHRAASADRGLQPTADLCRDCDISRLPDDFDPK